MQTVYRFLRISARQEIDIEDQENHQACERDCLDDVDALSPFVDAIIQNPENEERVS